MADTSNNQILSIDNSDEAVSRNSSGFAGFPKLLTNPKYSDLTVRAGTSLEIFKLHRAIISERSKYFDRACAGQFLESKTQEITLPEVQPSVFKHVVTYLYMGEYKESKVSAHEMVQIYETADYLDITGLKELIMTNVWKRLGNTEQNLDTTFAIGVLEMLAKVSSSYENENLEKVVKKLLERRKILVWLRSKSFKSLLDRYGVVGRLMLENISYQVSPIPESPKAARLST